MCDEAGDVGDKIGTKRSVEIWEILLVGEFSGLFRVFNFFLFL